MTEERNKSTRREKIHCHLRNDFYHNNVTLCLVTALAIYSQTFPCGHLY